MKLGVIIVTYNRLELLKECVQACLKQTLPFEKIFIVDNASTDGTDVYLSELDYKNLEYKTLSMNTGGAGGFSCGVNYFSDKEIDYVLFIDDDAIIEKDYNLKISKHISDNEKDIIAYSGNVLTNGKIIYEHRRYLNKGFKQKNSTDIDYKKDFFDYDLSTFCGVFISNDIIKQIGKPREDFFIWYDDTEFCLRLIKFGKIRNVNNASLNHKTKIDDSSGYSWKSYYGLRNRYIILREYYNKYYLIKYILTMSAYIVAGKIIGTLKKDEYYKKISKLYLDAMLDAKNDKLGINENYTYKTNLGSKNDV